MYNKYIFDGIKTTLAPTNGRRLLKIERCIVSFWHLAGVATGVPVGVRVRADALGSDRIERVGLVAALLLQWAIGVAVTEPARVWNTLRRTRTLTCNQTCPLQLLR